MWNGYRLGGKLLLAIFALTQAALLAFTPSFAAQSGAEGPFFKGKTLRIIVFTGPGGGYDTYSRLVARHIPKYIPGKPTAIVQNMTGGGGLIAANYLYNKAPQDGTVMLAAPWEVPILQLVGQRGVRFDIKKMSALGSADFQTNLIFTRRDRFSSFEELLQSKKLAKLASTGPGGASFTTGRVVEAVAGKRLFQIVRGYGSGREMALAVKRGEVDGTGFQLDVVKLYLWDMWKAGELAVLVQAGIGGKPHPELPDVPLISEIAKTPRGKRIARLTYPALTFGRGYWVGPEVPKERVKLLREVFWQVMHDAKFLTEAKRMGRGINPMRGKEVQEMWNEVLESPPDIAEIYRKIFKPGR